MASQEERPCTLRALHRQGEGGAQARHLLLGLLGEEDGLAAKVPHNLRVEIGTVRSTIESVLGRNERIIPTSRVKKVIEISFEEARRMGNSYVGTEHLLFGLLIEGRETLKAPGATEQPVRLHSLPPADVPTNDARVRVVNEVVCERWPSAISATRP